MSSNDSDETTKERILRIGAELFARRGYANTGVAELAEATGLGKGALYHHIVSKEELLFEISKRHVEDVLGDGEAIVASAGSPEDKLKRLYRLQMRVIADHLAEITLYFREQHSLTGTRRERLAQIRHRWEDIYRQILVQGVETGDFRSADPVAVKGMLGMLNYSWVWYRPDGPQTPEEIADRLAEIVLRGQLTSARDWDDGDFENPIATAIGEV